MSAQRTIPITVPIIGPEELEAVQRPLQSGWLVQGVFVQEFERKFAAYAGASHAVAASTCTAALHLAVAALGLGHGDEVIVPAFTWVSTANVVEYMGARPVFCDVELDTFNIDPRAVEALITPRTVGIMPVHLFGLCADMSAIMAIAARYGLWVVEDAACALGGRYRGQHAGTFGDAGCFSFHPRKSITTGEGGMLTTARQDVADRVRSLRDHGATRSDLTRHGANDGFLLADYPYLGYNYRLTDIQGALGSVQMDRAPWILEQRRRLARAYDAALQDLDWLVSPRVPDGYEHGYQSYVTLFRPEPPDLHNVEALHDRRNRLMRRLHQRGIATRQGTHAPVLVEYYARRYGLRAPDFPNALVADRLSLALPLYAQMTEDDQRYVIDALSSGADGVAASGSMSPRRDSEHVRHLRRASL